ncbi:hypothetical protein NECAME_07442 [Necator americanus]|uniref:Uncharacterized protein n=1 Tax=Necator americanus TaxID=51031 RepID=W2TNS6_NECAM|nr:hypothetical protein NECAME_07442 [Necator americanus]ETN83324.1 hypothetical protein NECAME_07442 [Necator americanus]
MSEQAIKMNATLATLLENLDVQLKRQTAVDIQVANITRMYACMAASSCVTKNVYCTAAFSSPVNTSIDLYVDVAINVDFSFTNSDTGFVETGSKSVVIVYSADRYSSIGFEITYNTVTSDPCSDYLCDADGGECMVVPSTGLPYCQFFDPCTATANRLCKNKGQTCGPNPNVTDYCGYVCHPSTTIAQGLAPTIATLTSWLQSWKIW